MIKLVKSKNSLNIEYTHGDTFKLQLLEEAAIDASRRVRFQISKTGDDNTIVINKQFSPTNDRFDISLTTAETALLQNGQMYEYRITYFETDSSIITTYSGTLNVVWGTSSTNSNKPDIPAIIVSGSSTEKKIKENKEAIDKIELQLDEKVDKTTYQAEIANKVNITDYESGMSEIDSLSDRVDANASSINANAQSISQVSNKADQINLDLQAKAKSLENNISQVSKDVDVVSGEIDKIELQLDEKVDKTTYESEIANKVNITDYESGMSEKVDKQSGKQLSTEDYTTSEKQKLNELSNAVAVDGDGNVDIKGRCSVDGIDILSQMDAIDLSAQDGIKALQSKSIPYEDISGYPVSVSDHLYSEDIIDYKIYGNSVQNGTPSIENPIEVQSVGDLITDETSEYYGKCDVPVTVTGKNLFNINGNINQFYPGLVMSGPNSNTNNGNGSITIHATTSATAGSGFKITNVAGKKYTFSCDVIDNGTGEGITVITCIPSQINYNIARNTAGKRMVFTVSFTEDIYEAIFSFATTKGVNGIVSNVQIELSDTATEYEPYQEPITKHIYLDEPLRKVDEYADYIDFKNQKVVRNIKRLTVDGTESGYAWGNWASESDKTTMVFTFQVSNSIKPLSRLGKLYSDEFKPLEQLEFNNDKEGIFQGGDTFHIRINKSRLNGETVNDFKNWLSSNNIYVYYILKTPIEEQITIPKLCTPKSEVMNISSGTTLLPSSMDIKYYQDIKKIINNLTNAILSQGGDV